MGNQQVTEFDCGWLVGVMDGEGCFTIARTLRRGVVSYTPSIKFVNTNLEIVDKLSRILKSLGVRHVIYDSFRTGNQRPAKRLEIIGLDQVKKYLDFVIPMMECRIDQATILKEFVELRISKGKEAYSNEEPTLYSILSGLNQRGSGTSETRRDPS